MRLLKSKWNFFSVLFLFFLYILLYLSQVIFFNLTNCDIAISCLFRFMHLILKRNKIGWIPIWKWTSLSEKEEAVVEEHEGGRGSSWRRKTTNIVCHLGGPQVPKVIIYKAVNQGDSKTDRSTLTRWPKWNKPNETNNKYNADNTNIIEMITIWLSKKYLRMDENFLKIS